MLHNTQRVCLGWLEEVGGVLHELQCLGWAARGVAAGASRPRQGCGGTRHSISFALCSGTRSRTALCTGFPQTEVPQIFSTWIMTITLLIIDELFRLNFS